MLLRERVARADFRSALYGRYISTFKGEHAAEPSFVWWDHKLLPLLEGVAPDAPILEIGCGSGGLLAYLARRGFSHAAGVDISAEQVALAHARGVRAIQGDALALLLERPEAFAAILAVDVFEHFARDELPQLADRIHAALRESGRLIVQTANGAGLYPGQVIYGDLTHMTIFTPESLAQLLRPAGFAEILAYEAGPIPIRLRGRANVAMWRAITALASAVRYIETGKRQTIWTETFLCRATKR